MFIPKLDVLCLKNDIPRSMARMHIMHIRCIALLLFTIWCYSDGLSCSDGKWGCLDESKCIPERRVCNGHDTCSDGSDENPVMCTQWNCTAGYWKCQDGLMCVEERRLCRGDDTCSDGSDEDPVMCAQWNCTAGHWKCQDGLQCVDEQLVCNGDVFCHDGSDEDPVMCAQWNCPAGRWKCKDGLQCVHSKICKGYGPKCHDESDEGPAICAHYQCPTGYWKCKDTLQCIEERYVCDADHQYALNCNDKSDEEPSVCAQWNCPAGHWKCNDGLQCVPEEYVCRFYTLGLFSSCNDKSDIDLAMCDSIYKQEDCTSGYRKCAGESYCRPEHLMCDGKKHCKLGSDEDPVMCAQWNCSYGHWRCADGLQCLPISWVCDGNRLPTYGCRDGSDEDPALCIHWDCNARLKYTQACENVDDCAFTKCADNLQCINRKSICDREFDCIDRSDELCNDGCHRSPLKPEEKDIVRKCQEDSVRCFSVKQSCDGIAQCPDASDETHVGCMCEDWGLKSCINNKTNPETYCLNVNWIQTEVLLNQSALNCMDILHHMDTEIKMIEYNTGLYYGHSCRSQI